MAESSTGKPDLSEVQTPAEFVDAMRRLKNWTGWGYRRLEKRAATAGDALPRSTLTVALTRETLPREDLVAAFARACGCDEEETTQWVAARRRIAGGGAAAPVKTEPPVPRRRLRTRRVAVGTAVLAITTAVAVFLAGLSSAPPEPGPDLAAPAQSQSQSPSGPATPTETTPTTASGTPTTTGSAAPPLGSAPPAPGNPIQLAGKPSASETPRLVLTNTVTVLSQLPPVPQPPPQPPGPLPRCADVTYRHVGARRVQLPSHSTSLDCVLSYGATGEGVEALQVALIYCNNAKYVSLTGTYDQKTAEAVYFIQTATGARAVDGIYGPETQANLNWVHHNGTDGTCTPYHDG